jgi:hypothetical protein
MDILAMGETFKDVLHDIVVNENLRNMGRNGCGNGSFMHHVLGGVLSAALGKGGVEKS